jgi:hypothetical protein
VTVTSSDGGDFRYKIGEFGAWVYFTLDPDEMYPITVPSGESFEVEAFYDEGYGARWTDELGVSRSADPTYTHVVHENMTLVAVFFKLPVPGKDASMFFPALFVILATTTLFIILATLQDRVIGTVRFDTEGIPDAVVGYRVNGNSVKSAKTDGSGVFEISVRRGATVTIVGVASEGYSVSGTLPMSIKPGKGEELVIQMKKN